MLTWWDAARAVWIYWVGMFRFVGVALGWAVTFSTFVVKLVLEVFRQVVLMPFTMTGRMTQTYFRPGVPWVAFVMLVFWCALEAAIFSYTLMPTVTELLTDLVGGESTAHYTTPILYCFLLLLVMGSFACVQSLMDALKKKDFKSIIQMVIVELFVMFFEVMFLYRELIDALTPWISQQTGMKMGLTFTLALSAFGWIGIRGMTWFLFGQYGTPPMLAFISRQPIVDEDDPRVANPKPAPAWWRQPVEELKKEIDWLHAKSEEILDYLVLPVLQIAAAVLNFGMVLVASRQVFSLPFKEGKEITPTWDILQTLHLPRKQATL